MIFRSVTPEIEIPNTSLTPFVLRHAQRLADKPALIDGPSGRMLTYAAVADGVCRMGAGLTERGFRKGDVFAIYAPNLPEYAIAVHAVASLGGITTPVNPLLTTGELACQLNDAGATYLLTVPACLDRATEAADQSQVREVFVIGEAAGATSFSSLLRDASEAPHVAINPREDLVLLPYSSGTTGLPKGVMLTHANLVANAAQLGGCEPISEADTLIGILPFFHIYGMTVLMNYALSVGATVVTLPRFDLEPFLQTLETYGVTYAYVAPPIVLALAKQPVVERYDLSRLTCVISGAAPLSPEIATTCRERVGCTIKQGYGLTEASPVTHVGPADPDRVDRSVATEHGG